MPKPSRQQFFKLWELFLWLALIFFMSSQVATTSSGMSRIFVEPIRPYSPSFTDGILTTLVRKSAHIFLFFTLGILTINAFKGFIARKRHLVAASLLFVFTYAVTDEFHQNFVAGRSSELRDVVIDTLAASAGIGIYCLFAHLQRNRKISMPAIKPSRTWIGNILAALVATSFAVTVYSVIKTSLVPGKYLLVLLPIASLLILGLVFALLKFSWKSIPKSLALIVMSLVVLFANGYVYSATTSTNDFLESVQGTDYVLESYSIVAKKDASVTVKNSKTIGYLNDDTSNEAALKATKTKTKAEPKASNELASLTVALDDRNVDTALLRSSILPLLEENYPSFYQDLKVLETFNVKVKKVTTKKTDITKPYAVFIGGIDTYGEIESVSRSDVNIVAVINPQTRKVLLINTPRDYYVQLHGTTGVRDKLTHAGIYGIDMSRQTLEDLYGTPIDYSVRINFTSLLKIVDTIGGVNVYSDNAFKSGTYSFVQGYNQLDSKQALEFSRTRKAFQSGDRTRGQNQQRVIEAIIAKVNDPRSLLKYQTIIGTLSDSFQTNASSDEVAALLKQQMNTLGSWKTESISVTGADSRGPTYSMGSLQLYVMEPDTASLDAAKAKILEYRQ